MRRLLYWLIALIAISIVAFLDYYPYQRALDKTAKEIVLVYQKKDWTFYKPWTWVIQPITQLMWVKDYAQINDQYVLADVAFKDKRGLIEDVNLLDIQNNKFALASSEDIRGVMIEDYPTKFKWVKADGGIESLIEYIKKDLSNP